MGLARAPVPARGGTQPVATGGTGPGKGFPGLTTVVADTRRCDGRVRREPGATGRQVAHIRARALALNLHVADGSCRYLHLVFSGLRLASAAAPRPLLLAFSPDHDPEGQAPAVQALGRLLDAAVEQSPGNARLVAHLALAMHALVGHHAGAVEPVQAASLSHLQLQRALSFMDGHLAEPLKLRDIAAACALSPGHFARAFQGSTGKTPYRWLLERRINEAQRLLVGTSMPLIDVGAHCGFASQSHFTRIFRNTVGMPPGLWRRGGQQDFSADA